ncbi:GNAT family N-acetyltransferase [Paenibacillus macerans]|uniref:GNAT family N-acetyltransferase n=1 Tax=Paenibacillus macerans TaxID=44252 RepID=UPI002DB56CDE|nr:GNAT family N-acetyltransferase [Paenibacillus macerans]MEC0334176.1 GNAT family N-acetyltransferase [Paenibacillus macerans]MED4958663.1 GNAT family N-acetyltransferase [Paenibacillus macerans]
MRASSLAIYSENDRKVWANPSLANFPKNLIRAELGLWIGEKTAWNKGNGMEAMQILAGFAFNRLNLHKIYLSKNTFQIS